MYVMINNIVADTSIIDEALVFSLRIEMFKEMRRRGKISGTPGRRSRPYLIRLFQKRTQEIS